ncbi:putative ankyrin repeat protein [Cotonvirus japonicus]|uniref:Ankyrin repeat protein n=1 Tax=Cotonvirus japonicus TaxID=2811091 RepID=A0ABM7NRH6_9VIRU|nr:putative ankyrin repeat protein [Cotonvirus japonicus]BCS82760.1 putative ankyrin repeat protein [Cotonvirus japonicus]
MDLLLPNQKFYKFINENWIQRDYLYKEGLNVLDKPFEPHGHCVPGGLYFTDIENILEFLDYGMRLVEVTIPFDAQIVEDNMFLPRKWRADKIFVKNIGLITEINTIKFLIEREVSIIEHIGELYNCSLRKNNYEFLKYLVKNFPCSCLQNNINLTILSYFDNYKGKIKRLLIKYGANINSFFLYHVVALENLNLTKTIIKYDQSKIPSLYKLAIKHNKLSIFEIICKYFPQIKSCYLINNEVFDCAALNGNINIIKYMIDNEFYLSVNIFNYILDKKLNGSIVVYLWANYVKITETNILTITNKNAKTFSGEIIKPFIFFQRFIDCFNDRFNDHINL